MLCPNSIDENTTEQAKSKYFFIAFKILVILIEFKITKKKKDEALYSSCYSKNIVRNSKTSFCNFNKCEILKIFLLWLILENYKQIMFLSDSIIN